MDKVPQEVLEQPPKTILEFDIAARTVAWGYSDVDKLYRDASSQDNLKYIDVPFMVLSAHDDPIA
jgi:predicted alpha/beta-fold hydrolase